MRAKYSAICAKTIIAYFHHLLSTSLSALFAGWHKLQKNSTLFVVQKQSAAIYTFMGCRKLWLLGKSISYPKFFLHICKGICILQPQHCSYHQKAHILLMVLCLAYEDYLSILRKGTWDNKYVLIDVHSLSSKLAGCFITGHQFWYNAYHDWCPVPFREVLDLQGFPDTF